jgi:hypothetical protein
MYDLAFDAKARPGDMISTSAGITIQVDQAKGVNT